MITSHVWQIATQWSAEACLDWPSTRRIEQGQQTFSIEGQRVANVSF